ncbi:DNA adenine methylase [Bacillus sp. JJ1566]|uniref:DNA adenine methylase n=1 Tax=Bacillus sp. JJ1566 TaxID=3122961 RepID=UPI002FFD749A
MSKDLLVKPVVKWAGGKRQLLDEITNYLPVEFNPRINTYFEPFFGGGALFFHIKPQKAFINDVNTELINLYQVIKHKPEKLISELINHKQRALNNESEYYYLLRDWDRKETYNQREDYVRAGRFVYLNRTGYNGLYRVNSKGQFNVPFGKYKNPDVIIEETIKDVSIYLKKNYYCGRRKGITITNQDFAESVLKLAKKGDFVYFDPPYDPVSETATFTAYDKGGFGRREQKRLKSIVTILSARGCYVMVSNSSTDFINSLYEGFEIVPVKANRSINSQGSKRGKVEEVLIMNYRNSKSRTILSTLYNHK